MALGINLFSVHQKSCQWSMTPTCYKIIQQLGISRSCSAIHDDIVKISLEEVDSPADVVGHRREQGKHSPHNYIYHLRLKDFGSEADLDYRARQVPQRQELISAYRAQHQLERITPPPCNKWKHLASKDSNPLRSDNASKDVSPLESKPPIRKRKSRSGSNEEKNSLKRRK